MPESEESFLDDIMSLSLDNLLGMDGRQSSPKTPTDEWMEAGSPTSVALLDESFLGFFSLSADGAKIPVSLAGLQDALDQSTMDIDGDRLTEEQLQLAISHSLLLVVQDEMLLPYGELLLQYSNGISCNYIDPMSGDSLLQKCIKYQNFPLAQLLIQHGADVHKFNSKNQMTSLHTACSVQNSLHWIELLCELGADVNAQNTEGQSPLHICLLGSTQSPFSQMQEMVTILIKYGADPNVLDHAGENVLLYIRTILQQGAFSLAKCLAEILLENGADVSCRNCHQKTLLAYSIGYLDNSIALTRLLINYGAFVWDTQGQDDTDHSAFSWYLKAVINQSQFTNCTVTLELISRVMGEYPKLMYAHMLRTMFRHVRCFRIFGPVFLQIKHVMMKYWTGPPHLRYLCWRAIRKSMSPTRIQRDACHLRIPLRLERYLTMEDIACDR